MNEIMGIPEPLSVDHIQERTSGHGVVITGLSSTSPTITTPTITGGTANNTVIGKTTPAEGWLSPSVAKGPAIITTFAGTVTAAASTTVTFSSAADAILAGYSATNPILGVTLISNALTRYIVSWTNATTCVVDSSVTWAGTAITSVQLPIEFAVDSSGAIKYWIDAAGGRYSVGNLRFRSAGIISNATADGADNSYLGFCGGGADGGGRGAYFYLSGNERSAFEGQFEIGAGQSGNAAGKIVMKTNGAVRYTITQDGNYIFDNTLTAAGTSAVRVLAIGSGTAPTTSPADAAQMWVADVGAVAGAAGLQMRNEQGQSGRVAFAPTLVSVATTPVTLTTAQIANCIIQVSGTASIINLPNIDASMDGMLIKFRSIAALAFYINPDNSDYMDLAGTVLDAGDSIKAPGAAGDYVELYCDATNNTWRTLGMSGVFTDGA